MHCFLTSNTKACYLKISEIIKNLCLEFCLVWKIFNINNIYLNFEINAHNAVRNTSNAVNIKA